MKKILLLTMLGCLFSWAAPKSSLTAVCPDLAHYRYNASATWLTQHDTTRTGWPTTNSYASFLRYKSRDTTGNNFFADKHQRPVASDSSIGCFKNPDGFHTELWAAEDMTFLNNDFNAFAFNFDELGRAIVPHTSDYPNNLISTATNGIRSGNDRIVLIEDTDGDHVADKVKTLASGYNIPTSAISVIGGYLAFAPNVMIFIPDANKDGVADGSVAKVVATGMTPSDNYDSHGQFSSLTHNIDNRIYFSKGYNANTLVSSTDATGEGSGGTAHIGRFEFDHSNSTAINFKRYGRSGNGGNHWSLGINEEGNIFTSYATQNDRFSEYIPWFGHTGSPVISNYFNVSIPNKKGGQLFYVGDGLNDPRRDLNNDSFTTCGSGYRIYTARYFPSEYWNKTAFNAEGCYQLAHTSFLSRNKSIWNDRQATEQSDRNIIWSTDGFFSPVDLQVGPDNSLWVIDLYTLVFLHNGAIPQGSGSAYKTGDDGYTRDNSRSRIYRVVRSSAATFTATTSEQLLSSIIDSNKLFNYTKFNLITGSVGGVPYNNIELRIQFLAHTNMLWRLHAQRLLIEAASNSVADSTRIVNLLEANVLTRRYVDTEGIAPAVLHALWTLKGMGTIDSDPTNWIPKLATLLTHPSFAVRKAAIQVMPTANANNTAVINAASTAGIVNDVDPHVRLAALDFLRRLTANTPRIAVSNSFCMTDTYSQDRSTDNLFNCTSSGLTNSILQSSTRIASLPLASTPIAVDSRLFNSSNITTSLRLQGNQLLFSGTVSGGTIEFRSLDGRYLGSSLFGADGTLATNLNLQRGLSIGVVNMIGESSPRNYKMINL